jgi:hypothetical protein
VIIIIHPKGGKNYLNHDATQRALEKEPGLNPTVSPGPPVSVDAKIDAKTRLEYRFLPTQSDDKAFKMCSLLVRPPPSHGGGHSFARIDERQTPSPSRAAPSRSTVNLPIPDKSQLSPDK